jgi:hypothetical protein
MLRVRARGVQTVFCSILHFWTMPRVGTSRTRTRTRERRVTVFGQSVLVIPLEKSWTSDPTSDRWRGPLGGGVAKTQSRRAMDALALAVAAAAVVPLRGLVLAARDKIIRRPAATKLKRAEVTSAHALQVRCRCSCKTAPTTSRCA